MGKMIFSGIASIFMFTLILPLHGSAAEWQLYDDFSSGEIDTGKWQNTSDVSTMSVENGQLKIVHAAGNPNKSGYLEFISSPESIYGIKASMTIASCTGDMYARLAGYAASYGGNDIWTNIKLRPDQNRIGTLSTLETPAPDYTHIKRLHSASFRRNINIVGETYTFSMVFEEEEIKYSVDGLGTISYEYPFSVIPSANSFRAIGTRSNNGDGPCTVYVDDVYILTQ